MDGDSLRRARAKTGRLFRPFRASRGYVHVTPGRRCAAVAAPLCPGLVCGCPFGAERMARRQPAVADLAAHFGARPGTKQSGAAHWLRLSSGRMCRDVLRRDGGGAVSAEDRPAHLSGEGVKVSVGKYYRPLTEGEFGALRQKLDDKREQLEAEQKAQGNLQPLKPEAIAKAAGVTEEQLKEMEIYRQREADPKRQPNAQIEEELTLRVEIDASAPSANVNFV